MTRARRTSGFTLIELIVVIAIIGLLVVVLVPAIDALFGGKNLKMARNAVNGYLSALRSEAVKTNRGMVIAVLPPKDGDMTHQWEIEAPAGTQSAKVKVMSGFVPFLIDSNAPDGSEPWQRVQYMGDDFNYIFITQFSSGIELHPDKVRQWKTHTPPDVPGVKGEDFTKIGIPPGSYLIYLGPDGKALIPGDVPGYIVEGATAKDLDGDLVFHDRRAVLFLDINHGLQVRANLMSYSLYQGGRYPVPQ